MKQEYLEKSVTDEITLRHHEAWDGVSLTVSDPYESGEFFLNEQQLRHLAITALWFAKRLAEEAVA